MDMEMLKTVLEQVGVLGWLQGLFPDTEPGDLIQRVDQDFDGLISDLENARAAREAATRGSRKWRSAHDRK
jgi:hypothetical protein